MSNIHNTAIINQGAKIDDSVKIGAYCVIGENVEFGRDVTLHSHVVVDGHTKIGNGTEIFPFASIGHVPQDLKFGGEVSRLEIGENNVIREHVTMNPGTEGGGLLTKVGDNCLFMMASHIAHDCMVGNNVILANNATLAGHVEVDDFVIIGGLSAVHQFVRIGKNAMIGGMSAVAADVAPFASVTGDRAYLAGLNLIGLKRSGMNRESVHALRNAYKKVFESDEGTLAVRAADVAAEYVNIQEVQDMLSFLFDDSSRSFCVPKAS